MWRGIPRHVAVVASCIVVAACRVTDRIAPGARDNPGLIIFYGDTSGVVAPDTVTHDVAFEIEFRTFAGGCTRRIARTDVEISGSRADIRPYNHSDGGVVCPADLMFLRHTAQVRFDSPGVAVIRVIGEQRGASTGNVNGPAELTRLVVVR